MRVRLVAVLALSVALLAAVSSTSAADASPKPYPGPAAYATRPGGTTYNGSEVGAAETFTSAVTATLASVTMGISVHTGSSPVTVAVTDASAAPKPGVVLASATMSVSGTALRTFDLSAAGVTLTAGTQYVLEVTVAPTVGFPVTVAVPGNASSLYLSDGTYWFSGDTGGIAQALDATVNTWLWDADPPSITPGLTGTRTYDSSRNLYWYSQSPPTVTWTCSDLTSGVASCTGPASVADGAPAVLTGTATDVAGWVTQTSADIYVDTLPPSVNVRAVGTVGNAGWYRSSVKVYFSCADATSGVAECPQNRTVVGQGPFTVDWAGEDWAGNQTSGELNLRLDNRPPTVQLTRTPKPNAAGWTRGGRGAKVSFRCSDTTSGLATCPTSLAWTKPGIHRKAVVASDIAGNRWTSTIVVRYDPTGPTRPVIHVGRKILQPGRIFATTPRLTCHATDQVSGMAGCRVTVRKITSSEREATALARDRAGNVTRAYVRFRVQ